jgi:hypothetical protein
MGPCHTVDWKQPTLCAPGSPQPGHARGPACCKPWRLPVLVHKGHHMSCPLLLRSHAQHVVTHMLLAADIGVATGPLLAHR